MQAICGTDYWLQIACCSLQVGDYRLHVTAYRLQVRACRLEIADCRLQARVYRLYATYYSLQLAGYVLHITCYSLRLTDYGLQITGCRCMQKNGVHVKNIFNNWLLRKLYVLLWFTQCFASKVGLYYISSNTFPQYIKDLSKFFVLLILKFLVDYNFLAEWIWHEVRLSGDCHYIAH